MCLYRGGRDTDRQMSEKTSTEKDTRTVIIQGPVPEWVKREKQDSHILLINYMVAIGVSPTVFEGVITAETSRLMLFIIIVQYEGQQL